MPFCVDAAAFLPVSTSSSLCVTFRCLPPPARGWGWPWSPWGYEIPTRSLFSFLSGVLIRNQSLFAMTGPGIKQPACFVWVSTMCWTYNEWASTAFICVTQLDGKGCAIFVSIRLFVMIVIRLQQKESVMPCFIYWKMSIFKNYFQAQYEPSPIKGCISINIFCSFCLF